MKYFGTNLREAGHYFWDISGEGMRCEWLDFKSYPFNPENLFKDQKNGAVAFLQTGGFTVLGICGSPVDSRPGCKSVFILKETISKTEMVDRIRQNSVAMQIVKAMPFKVEIEFNGLDPQLFLQQLKNLSAEERDKVFEAKVQNVKDILEEIKKEAEIKTGILIKFVADLKKGVAAL